MSDKIRKKKKKRVRGGDWQEHHEESFSHDHVKHLRTGSQPGEEEPVPGIPEGKTPNAVVISTTGPWAFLEMGGIECRCRIHEKLMVGRASVLAPGDVVLVEEMGDTPMVQALGPRRTKLSRPSLHSARIQEQVIAANIDVLVIVVSTCKPRFKPGLLDRYFIVAEVGGVEPIICVNKMDLVDKEPKEVEAYRELGYTVVNTSCETGEGVGELRSKLSGKLSVLAGHSGVGKSSLLNKMDSELRIAVQEVSDYNEKGKHTTSAARLYRLGDGIRVIDTPGIRQLGLWNVTHQELAFYFPEFVELAMRCRFRNCTHIHEPDCAIRDAVEKGEMTRRRYDSYFRIFGDLEDKSVKY